MDMRREKELRLKEILQHALGDESMARNHFVTSVYIKDYQDCVDLVELGLMKKVETPAHYSVLSECFFVTEKGKEIAFSSVDISSTANALK